MKPVKCLAVLGLTLLIALPVFASQNQRVVIGDACHGANVFNNQPITSYEKTAAFLPPDVFAFWHNFFAVEVGYQGEEASAAITEDTPLDALMATYISPTWAALAEAGGLDLDTLDPSFENVPIHQVHMIDDPFGTRRQVPSSVPSKLLPVNTYKPVTVAAWNQANGQAILRCNGDGTGNVRIIAHDLVPRGVYTVWAIHAVTSIVNPPGGPVAGAPLGGVPNSVIADEHGSLSYDRDLTWCPLDIDDPLMYIALFLHWDHALYGSQFGTYLVGQLPGLIGSDHLCFATGDVLAP